VPLARAPTVTSRYVDPEMDSALAQAVAKLLEKDAIEEVYYPASRGFYSRLFLRPKASGGWRPIIDLKPLNPFIGGDRIKQETQAQIRASLQPNQWTISVDLQDAFFHIPIHRESRRYLRFHFQGRTFQYKALPFGLKTAPWIFTVVMAQVQQMPETHDINLHLYLDDWLAPVPDFATGVRHSTTLVQLCRDLGLVINMEKSDLVPAQVFVHLGAHYNLRTYRVNMTRDNIETLRRVASTFLSTPSLPAREWLSLIGLLNSQEKFTQYGRTKLRDIQWCLKRQWAPAAHKLGQMVFVSDEVRRALRWWLDESNLARGAPIRLPEPQVLVQTDASKAGWGGHSGNRTFQGIWTPIEALLHINILEMRAVTLTLTALAPPAGVVVMVATDNTTVMHHINKQGGIRSQSMWSETKRLLQLAETNSWTLVSKHVPGRLNIVADQLSRRGQCQQTEWELHQDAARALFQRWGTPNIDMFATKINRKLPVFISPVVDDEALEVDALSIPWEGMSGYAFPPYKILPQVLHKVQQTSALRMILVAPLWE